MMERSARPLRSPAQQAPEGWGEDPFLAHAAGCDGEGCVDAFDERNPNDDGGPAPDFAYERHGEPQSAPHGATGRVPGTNLDGAQPPAGPPAAAPSRLQPAATEAQLANWIAAIGQRDEKALACLYDATVSRVHGLVLKIVRKSALAEEVVEDTFFQVWRQALRLDATRGAPMAWLLGMARSRAIDGLRREARFQAQSLDLDCMAEVVDGAPAADELLDVARGHADLHQALMMLNAQPRQLVALAFFRGLSHEEIAHQTQLPLGTVKSQIRRALLLLRQSLGDAAFPGWAT